VWLIAGINVRLTRRFSGWGRLLQSALASLLALLLVAAATCSVSHALHQCLHRDSATPDHFCLVCSLATGQVSAADVVVASTLAVFCWVCGIRVANPSPLPGFDYRFSPSRAPPARASFLSVVA
jgi:hypothetical protein